MPTTWSDWIPRERDDCQFKLEDLPRFYGRVWFPDGEKKTVPPSNEAVPGDLPPTQPEAKPKEND